LLDWGCGCARLTAHFARLLPESAICGCDIDADAVRWCQASFPRAEFAVNSLEPPLPYPPDSFDIVVASSVMTHLDRQRQQAWLQEVRRVLRAGGVFVASTHGEFAAAFHKGELARLRNEQIVDGIHDPALDGVVQSGYYRSVFQTESYTAAHWGRHLRVLEHIPAGLVGYQDLVVLQK
jgi:SAM-dependent methyltransferase